MSKSSTLKMPHPLPQAEIVKLCGYQDYPLQARYWKAADAKAILVLVHGVVSHSLWFSPIVAHLLDAGISCVAADRRGAGLHSRERGDAPSTEALYADLDAVLEFADSSHLPLHLAGFCWGANYLTNYLAARSPQYQSICLLVPSLFQSKDLMNAQVLINDSADASESSITPIEKFTHGPALEEFIIPDQLRLRKVSPRFNGVMQEFSRAVWMKILKIKSPMLCILADDDEMVDNAATETLFDARKVNNGELHYVEGGHGVQFDSPQQAAAIMTRWIATFDSDAGKTQLAKEPMSLDVDE